MHSLNTNIETGFLFNSYYGSLALCSIGLSLAYKVFSSVFRPPPPNTETFTTPISRAWRVHTSGQISLMRAFPLSKEEGAFLELKKQMHWLNLKGETNLRGKRVHLSGGPTHYFFRNIGDLLEQFGVQFKHHLSLKPKKLQILKDALYFDTNHDNYDKVARRIQRGRLTFLDGGWSGHAVCLAFFQGYMAIGNPGEGSEKGSLLIYKIDPERVDAQIVQAIRKNVEKPLREGAEFIYTILPHSLSASEHLEKDEMGRLLEAIAPKKQFSPICSLASKRAALPFAWALLLSKTPSLPALVQANEESKLFFDWAALQVGKVSLPPIQGGGIHEQKARRMAELERRVTLAAETLHIPPEAL